jgi:hypothetical protein
MKRIFAPILIVLLCSVNLSAADLYQTFNNKLVAIGDLIERTENVPVVNKLTNLLPFAVLAASLKECPMQTFMVVAGLLAYIASHNESVRSKLSEYSELSRAWWQGNKIRAVYIDDSLFIFDGEDAEDSEEESLTEDTLLFGEDEDENEDDMRTTHRRQKFTRNSLL